MRASIRKADILIEAIPYIQAFRGKVIVAKCGGSAIDDPAAMRRILQDLIFLTEVGVRSVLVHGGGPAITKRLAASGAQRRFPMVSRQRRILARGVFSRQSRGPRRPGPAIVSELVERARGRRAYRRTKSALNRTDWGIVRPSVRAVLRFTASSKVTGCSTGRSLGRVPLRILST